MFQSRSQSSFTKKIYLSLLISLLEYKKLYGKVYVYSTSGHWFGKLVTVVHYVVYCCLCFGMILCKSYRVTVFSDSAMRCVIVLSVIDYLHIFLE
jgi:hypothetical protein